MLSKSTTLSSRRIDLDEVAGLMIIYMILGHIFQWAGIRDTYIQKALNYMFFYFMPWFFFKAGMFACEKKYKGILKSGFNRLIKPFILFSIIGHGVNMIRMWIKGDINWVHYILSPVKQFFLDGSIAGNYALWFLFTLFIVRILGNYVCIKHDKRYTVFIILICFLFAFLLYLFNLHKPVYIGNICSGLSFYLIGMLMKEKQYDKSVFIASGSLFILVSFICPLGGGRYES